MRPGRRKEPEEAHGPIPRRRSLQASKSKRLEKAQGQDGQEKAGRVLRTWARLPGGQQGEPEAEWQVAGCLAGQARGGGGRGEGGQRAE